MKWESVLAWRMQRQHLTARAADPLAVVSDVCGLHAQVLSSAQLTLWARVEDAPDVNELLWRDRSLVKTWAQRGTLHLHRTDELPLWVAAQAALKPRYETRAWLKHFKLSEADVRTILEGVPAALREGPKSREELAEIHPLLKRGYGDLLKPLAFRGELVYTEDGRFALPEPFEPMDVEAATREVARRFLTRYGPASREALAKWFGHPSPAQAGKWFPADEVVETEFGLALAADVEAIEAAEPEGHVRLLPAFDQFVVAAPRGDDRIYRPGGWFSPVLLVDGEMAGVWTLDDGVVTIEPFATVSKAVREAAEAEAARLPHLRDVRWG